jgi:hypothetical protein
MIRITYAPDLVEEAVLLAEQSMTTADRRAFRRARDPLYEERRTDGNEERFRALHEDWFDRLGLRRPIEACLAERRNIVQQLRDARVLSAVSRGEEGADLIDQLAPGRSDALPLLAIRLRPSSLLDAPALQALLRHELWHVDDMIDPAFGYERRLPPSDLGPLGDHLVQARYRVAWNATIDGRLSRDGFADIEAVAAHRREFTAAFSMLAPHADSAFDRWFHIEHPTHAALAAFARTPTLDLCEDPHDAAVQVSHR